MATYNANAQTVQHDWYLVDAANKTLGRLASEIAHRLRGKHKVIYTPHVDTGDFVVVVNAGKVRVTGRKMTDKIYYHSSGYQGGIKEISLGKMLAAHPTRVLEKAIKGMLPKGPLGRKMFRKLKIYAGATHPHAAQNPESIEIKEA